MERACLHPEWLVPLFYLPIGGACWYALIMYAWKRSDFVVFVCFGDTFEISTECKMNRCAALY